MLVLLCKLFFQNLGAKKLTNEIRVPLWGGLTAYGWTKGTFWGDGCTTLEIYYDHNYNGWILWYVNYTLIKLLKFNKLGYQIKPKKIILVYTSHKEQKANIIIYCTISSHASSFPDPFLKR